MMLFLNEKNMTKKKITIFIEDTNLIESGKILLGKTDQGICVCLIGKTTEEVCQEFDNMFVGFDVRVISYTEDQNEFEGDFSRIIKCLKNPKIVQEMDIDFCFGTEFQKKVWKAIKEIPIGQTRTYSIIANYIGYPNAVRAVGSACGKNPITIIVPCHRVVSKTGLGKYKFGTKLKKKLLAREKLYVI